MRLLGWIGLIVSLVSLQATESLEQALVSKVVLITGCSRGIGLSTAELLAQKGYVVYATVRGAHPSASHENLHFKCLDVTDASSIKKTVDEIIAKEEHLDVLINNAGCALCGPLECLAMKDIVAQMDVNFFGAIRTCQEVLPHMRRQKSGHIINISSEQGVYGLPYGSLYTASKAALESLSEALSLEVLPWNISVSIVEPGPVATNFSVNWGTRPLEHSPYQAICRKIEDSLQQKREPSEFCQSAIEIAHFIQKVIEDPKPQLRYQTSKKVEETVARSICDLSGADYTMRMKSLLIEAYKEAWSSD